MFRASKPTAVLNRGVASPRANRRLMRGLSKSEEDLTHDRPNRKFSASGTNIPFINLDFDSKGKSFYLLNITYNIKFCYFKMKLIKLNTLNFITDLGGSLQKDLNVATQALEDVALESANVAKEVSKEVLNPLAKFTKVRKKISAPFRFRVIII